MKQQTKSSATSKATSKQSADIRIPKKAAGAVAGAVVGAVVGGPVGAAVGGIVGTLVATKSQNGTLNLAAIKRSSPSLPKTSRQLKRGAKRLVSAAAPVAKRKPARAKSHAKRASK